MLSNASKKARKGTDNDELELGATFADAKDECERANQSFQGWVKRYTNCTEQTARRLCLIGEKLRLEAPAGSFRPELPAGASISSLEALLSAPPEVQEQVDKGKIKPTRDEIVEATRKLESERAAKELAERKAKTANEAALRATKRLEELKQQQDKSLKQASEAGRKEAEDKYATLFEQARKAQQKAEREATKAREELANAAEQTTVRAQWAQSAKACGNHLKQALTELPTPAQTRYFGTNDWNMLHDLKRLAEEATQRLSQLEHLPRTVESGS